MKLYHRIIGDGEPLIILHGLFGFSDNWQTLGKRFAEKNQVVLVDLTNHGQSPWSDQFDYSSMARDLNELITDLNLKSPSILGHSMGGKVTMEYAVTFGQLSKMIIADIGPKFYPPHHNTIIEGLQAIDLKSLKSRGEADKLLGQYVSNMGERQFLLKNLKRSSIKLFDNLKNQIGRLDATICISLLDQGSVEMIKQRQAYRETAIKGARIAHKYAQQDTEEEKVDYNLSVSKPKPVMQEGRLFESK